MEEQRKCEARGGTCKSYRRNVMRSSLVSTDFAMCRRVCVQRNNFSRDAKKLRDIWQQMC